MNSIKAELEMSITTRLEAEIVCFMQLVFLFQVMPPAFQSFQSYDFLCYFCGWPTLPKYVSGFNTAEIKRWK